MRVLLTGADGFIGKHVRLALAERQGFELMPVGRATTGAELAAAAAGAEAVIHLAGVNRPQDPAEFTRGNADFTARLCRLLGDAGRAVPVAFASSIQAELDNPYGRSKRAAERHLEAHAAASGAAVALYRLPNVFGMWCKPNYNSVVATFCHNIAHDLPIEVHDPDAALELVYVDDVVEAFRAFLAAPPRGAVYREVQPVYRTTVGELARQIAAFRESRRTLVTERVGGGLTRALYATYLSYLPPSDFTYRLEKHGDERGAFVEVLKTGDSGQFSFFTAHPGVTRGGHYHHTKSEKFLVVKGRARFRFRHILSNETHELETSEARPVIVEAVPGWAHDVTNIGDEEMVVLLWANEIFDRARPDTFQHVVSEEPAAGARVK